MQCPKCGSTYNHVKNSRTTRKGTQIWRRRRCLKCSSVYTTHEIRDLSHVIVVKKTGLHERYSSMKLYVGIHNATLKSSNYDKEKQVATIVHHVEQQLLSMQRKYISSEELADIILSTLVDVNIPAFQRFLAYNKKFSTKRQLFRLIQKYTRAG